MNDPNRMKLYVTPHSHIDVDWMWTFPTTKKLLDQIFKQNLFPLMKRDPAYRFCQDQTLLLRTLLESLDDDERKFFFEQIEEKKFEPVGGMFVQPQFVEPCGESIIRQIQVGQSWLQKTFGMKATVAWNIDSFSQIGQMPQILMKSGFHSLVFMRDVPPELADGFPQDFWLESPDGSKILTHYLAETYVLCPAEDKNLVFSVGSCSFAREDLPEIFSKVFRPFLDENSTQRRMGAALLPWGHDCYIHLHTADEVKSLLIEAARAANVELTKDDISICTPSEYFEAIKDKADILDVLDTDLNPPLYCQDLRGGYYTRTKLKQLNRHAEHMLLSLESLICARGMDISVYQNGIADMWEDVLYCQFHDTIGGTIADDAYTCALGKYERTIGRATSFMADIMQHDENGERLSVYNPAPFCISGYASIELLSGGSEVWDDSGNRVLSSVTHRYGRRMLEFFVQGLDAFSIRQYSLRPTDEKDTGRSNADAIENQYFTVRVDTATGCLSSIYDKKRKKELMKPGRPGNEVVAIEEENPMMDGNLKLTDKVYYASSFQTLAYACTSTDTESRITVTKAFLDFSIVQHTILKENLDMVLFETVIKDYTGKDLSIKVSFPFNQSDGCKKVFESAFAVQERSEGLYCAGNWTGVFEDGHGAVLLNRGTPGYWVENNRLDIMLLRSFSNCMDYVPLGIKGGWPEYDGGHTQTELARELGDHSYEYALVSTGDDYSEAIMRGIQYNSEPFVVRSSSNDAGCNQIVNNRNEKFMITAIQSEQSGAGTIIRGFNSSCEAQDVTLDVAMDIKSAHFLNLLNEKLEILDVSDNSVRIKCKPYEIVSMLFER